MKRRKPTRRFTPPLGVMPHLLWCEVVERNPSLLELLKRYIDVCDAVKRYRDSGIEPLHTWLEEIGAR
jgi:hypothetical protein